jgi:hypothetical protein
MLLGGKGERWDGALRRAFPRIAAAVLILLGTLAFAAPARAACEGLQYPLAQFDRPGLRAYLMGTIAELEGYFEVSYPTKCIEPNYPGAHVEIATGTLVLGTQLLDQLGQKSLNHITAVLAHETAHQFQITHGLIQLLTKLDANRVKCIELHADYMAGGFMRWRAAYMNVDPVTLADSFFDLGDSFVHEYDHHGLFQERYVAFASGYSRLYKDVYTNASTGMKYVSQAKCDPD